MSRIKEANRQHILFHLKDASEQLTNIIEDLQKGSLDEAELRSDLKHAYHHLNWAWNGRKASKEEVASISQEDFEKWWLFPTDIEIEDS